MGKKFTRCQISSFSTKKLKTKKIWWHHFQALPYFAWISQKMALNPILFSSNASKILDWLHSSGTLGQNRNGNNLNTNDCTFKVAEYLIRVLFNNSFSIAYQKVFVKIRIWSNKVVLIIGTLSLKSNNGNFHKPLKLP